MKSIMQPAAASRLPNEKVAFKTWYQNAEEIKATYFITQMHCPYDVAALADSLCNTHVLMI